MAKIASDENAPVKPLLDSNRVKAVLNRKVGTVSQLQDRVGMEVAIGLNTWLTEYNVTLDL